MIREFRTWLAAGFLVTVVIVPVAGSEEIPRLTFAQLVDSIRADSGVTEKIKSYNGKEVAIQGFIVPAGPPDLSFFLLSRVSALGNYCCEAPVGQDETVYVFAEKEVNISYDPLRTRAMRASKRPWVLRSSRLEKIQLLPRSRKGRGPARRVAGGWPRDGPHATRSPCLICNPMVSTRSLKSARKTLMISATN